MRYTGTVLRITLDRAMQALCDDYAVQLDVRDTLHRTAATTREYDLHTMATCALIDHWYTCIRIHPDLPKDADLWIELPAATTAYYIGQAMCAMAQSAHSRQLSWL